ncbi:hypothetical protein VB779_09500 [Haloarculaceae archaeon H-GB11]|nr:hypothetical protein [Haloarculaceae archaeon H-GB11]
MFGSSDEDDDSGHVITVTTERPVVLEFYYDSRDGVQKEKVDETVGQIQSAECSCGESLSSEHSIQRHLREVYDDA